MCRIMVSKYHNENYYYGCDYSAVALPAACYGGRCTVAVVQSVSCYGCRQTWMAYIRRVGFVFQSLGYGARNGTPGVGYIYIYLYIPGIYICKNIYQGILVYIYRSSSLNTAVRTMCIMYVVLNNVLRTC